MFSASGLPKKNVFWLKNGTVPNRPRTIENSHRKVEPMRLPAFVVLATTLTLYSPTTFAAPGQQSGKDGEFEAREYKDANGAVLPYRLLKPNGYGTSKKPHSLLVFLHGAGERGTNNTAQLRHGKKFMQTAAKEYGSFVLAPQCPNGKRWSEVYWFATDHAISDTPAEPMRQVLELIARLQKEFRIDPDRLYVMGLSMGGFGTWDVVQRHPKVFAAAVPICGGGDESKAGRIAKLPTWVFHGAKDGAVKVERSRDMVKAIRAAGGNPKYTEFADAGHNAWTPAFSQPELLKWLFAQKRAAE